MVSALACANREGQNKERIKTSNRSVFFIDYDFNAKELVYQLPLGCAIILDMNMILFEERPLNDIIPIEDERAKHILNILKLKDGGTFRMGIVNESEGTATIKDIGLDGIAVEYHVECRPRLYPVTLLCAQVRPICMKRILREAVSLGVERILLTGSDTGEKSYLSSNLYRTGEYKEYLLDGAMQSCHAGVPEVVFSNTVDGALKAIGNAFCKASILDKTDVPESGLSNDIAKIMLDNVVGAVPLSGVDLKCVDGVVLAIGPERGWSDRERGLFVANGFKPMLLGNRVLRTETACSAGLAVLLSRMGLL